MVVVLTKVDLLLKSTDSVQEARGTLTKIIQRMRKDLTIAGASDILPFTIVDAAWGRDMLESIRRKVDALAKGAHQHRTVSANISQLISSIQDVMKTTDLIVSTCPLITLNLLRYTVSVKIIFAHLKKSLKCTYAMILKRTLHVAWKYYMRCVTSD